MDARCRLCAQVYEELIEILEEADLSPKIYKLFQVNIASNDRLPKTICQKCYETIHTTWSFNEQVQNAQVLLSQEYILKPPLIQSPTPNENNIVKTETIFMLSDFDEEDGSVKNECTSPELREADEREEKGLLPERSKGRYEVAFRLFKDWCQNKEVHDVSENILLTYFSELAKVKKASTLWATYSMLRKTLNIKKNIDISQYTKLQTYLRKQNVGYVAKKSSVFTPADINKFLNEAPLDFLPQKVALIIGISGACRSDELFKMKITDINFLDNKVCIVIPVTKTFQPRSFVVTNLQWIAILREYIALRKHIETDRFFMQLRFGRITKQPFGHNAIGQFPKKIADYLKLSSVDSYTGHCFRRTAATLLANNGGGVLHLKRLGGWKSSAVAESYIEKSSYDEMDVAHMLSTQETSCPSSAPGPSS